MRILRKAAALLICLSVVWGIVPATPVEAAASGLTPSADPLQAVCPHCDTVPQWQAWDGTTTAGHFYLNEPSSISPGIKVSGELILNLNGKRLTSTKGGKVFLVSSGGKLVVMDASVEGTGSVSGLGSATSHAGMFQGNGGDIDLYGGTYWLSNRNTMSSEGNGGIAYLSAGSAMKVYGGKFYGASYKNGGTFAVNNATLLLQDANVLAGAATAKGDSIWVDHENSILQISGNTTIAGGVQIVKAQTVSLSGKPVIEKAEGGSAYSLKLASGVKLELGELQEGSRIGVTASGNFAGTFETPDQAYQAAKTMFFSEDETKTVKSKGLELVMAAAEDPTGVTCPHCDTVPQWTPWDGASDPAAGHYYLTGDTLQTGNATFTASSEAVMVLNLNGYTLGRESGRMFLVQNSAQLVVMDSSEDGTGAMRGMDTADLNGSLMMTHSKGTIEILGGNFYLCDSDRVVGRGGLVYLSTGTVTVEDGTFFGTEAARGGAIGVNSAKLYLRGGTFYPGSATLGDTIHATGSSSIVDIRGDTVIEGGVEIGSISNFRISGGPTIRKEPGGGGYSLKTETPITLGTMESIRKIGITGECTVAEFDTATAATAAEKYFIAEVEGTCIRGEGTKLLCAAFTDPADNPNDPANDDELNILLIGNSYSYYWPDELCMLFDAAGYENVTIANVYYSGCYFERHWKWYEDGVSNYTFCVMNQSGQYKQYNKYNLLQCMSFKNWDIVSFQQSGRYVYSTTTPTKDLRESMEPWLGNLYDLLHSEFPYSDYYWLQSWAHEIGNGVSDLEAQKKVTAAHRTVGIEVCETYGFTRVPCGDAWELVRHDPIITENGWTLTTRTGDDADTEEKELLWDDLTHDGDVGGGQFLNACVWFEVITGRSVLNVPCAPFYLDSAGNRYDMSNEKVMLLKNAAHTAVAGVYGEPPAVRGDMNGDGEVTDADALYLLRHTLFSDRYPITGQSGDVNGDGATTDADALYLLRHTLFAERYPLN